MLREHTSISTFSLMFRIAVLYPRVVFFFVLYVGIKSHFIGRRIGRKYVKVRHKTEKRGLNANERDEKKSCQLCIQM